MLTQEALNQYHSEAMKLSIVLFDEIEKSSDTLWSLLLGILDNATLTLGDNRRVDFSKVIIVMTSNLGAREITNRDIGYVEPSEEHDVKRMENIAISAAKSKFSPEFMNRLQSIVVFKPLTEENISRILEIELNALEMRLFMASKPFFTISVSPKAKRTLLAEGYNKTYGARYLKRTIERRVQQPLARLASSGQITEHDVIIVDDIGEKDFEFYAQGRVL
jgi:ATP-dependent Clp protease ATP-binding subunit ClpA